MTRSQEHRFSETVSTVVEEDPRDLFRSTLWPGLFMKVWCFEGARLQPCRRVGFLAVALATEGPRFRNRLRKSSRGLKPSALAGHGAAEAAPLP